MDLKHTHMGWCFLILVNFPATSNSVIFFVKFSTVSYKKRLGYYQQPLLPWNFALTPLGWKPVLWGIFRTKPAFSDVIHAIIFGLYTHAASSLPHKSKTFFGSFMQTKVYESHTQLCIISVCQAQQQNATFNPVPLRGLIERNWACPLSSVSCFFTVCRDVLPFQCLGVLFCNSILWTHARNTALG